MTTRLLLAAGALALSATIAFGQMNHGSGAHHGSHDAAAAQSGDTPATKAYRAANATMHKDMDIDFTGNADVDFVRGMIAHHKGAVDMAKAVIAYGKDQQIRKLAEEIVKAQESEIALMQAWLKTNAR